MWFGSQNLVFEDFTFFARIVLSSCALTLKLLIEYPQIPGHHDYIITRIRSYDYTRICKFAIQPHTSWEGIQNKTLIFFLKRSKKILKYSEIIKVKNAGK